MLNPKEVDYAKLGFHAGIEVHHQIKSDRKLFCYCKPNLVKSTTPPDYVFERYFRPVLGEMGDFDPGMLIEYEKGYRCIYHAYEDVDCIYEQDEQPPFWPDMGAIISGYELGHWLNMSAMVDEIIFARKQYLDGSITTGFQRTTIVARDGYAIVDGNKHRISNITVEEDSARKIRTENNGRTVYYNLDRLGVPLVEVITDHTDVTHPKQLEKLARMIGLTLRLSGIGKRGIGAARQDVNISIAGGDRVELKGVQDLSMFEKWCCHESIRQDMLLKIATLLHERHFQKDDLEHTYIDLTEQFADLPPNAVVMGIRLPNTAEIFSLEIQPGKDFGLDIIEKAALISGIRQGNMFFSHEIDPQAIRRQYLDLDNNTKENHNQEHFFFQQMTQDLDLKLRSILKIEAGADKDAYFLALGSQKWVIHAMKKVIERVKMALDGVPQETRRAMPDGNSEFLRVIHGKERLYPDTDTPMIDVNMDDVEALKKNVGKRPWELEVEFTEQFGLTFDHLEKLIRHDHVEAFYSLVQDNGIPATRAYRFLEETLIRLRREKVNIEALAHIDSVEILSGAQQGHYDYSFVPRIAKNKCEHPERPVIAILADMNLQSIDNPTLHTYYLQALEEWTQKHTPPTTKNFAPEAVLHHQIHQLTGIIMRKAHGAISGQRVKNYVQQHLEGAEV